MKYLSDYLNDKQSAIFNQYGAFFAFSQKQLDEKKKPGIKYASLGNGLIAPYYEADNLYHALGRCHKAAIAQDIAENGINAIIQRELGNYECQISMDISDAVDALQSYGITREQVQTQWPEYWNKCVENDWF